MPFSICPIWRSMGIICGNPCSLGLISFTATVMVAVTVTTQIDGNACLSLSLLRS